MHVRIEGSKQHSLRNLCGAPPHLRAQTFVLVSLAVASVCSDWFCSCIVTLVRMCRFNMHGLLVKLALLFSGLFFSVCFGVDTESTGLTPIEDTIISLVRNAVSPDVFQELGWNDLDVASQQLRQPRYRDAADLFSGFGNFSLSCSEQRLRCIALDSEFSPQHDLLTTCGFVFWINAILSIIPFGFAVVGIPCNTYGWLSRGHSGRRKDNPLGNTDRRDIADANRLLKRVCLLLLVLTLRSVYWVLENPLNSMLWAQPDFLRLRALLKRMGGIRGQRPTRHFLWLGWFGCPLAKPTVFEGIAPGMRFIKSKKPEWAMRKQTQTIGWYSWMQRQPDGTMKRRFMGKKNLRVVSRYPKPLTDKLGLVARWQKAAAAHRII